MHAKYVNLTRRGDPSVMPGRTCAGQILSRVHSVAWDSIATYSLLFLGSAGILCRIGRLRRGTTFVVRLLAVWSLLAVCGPLGWTDYALGSDLLLRDVFSVFAPRRALFIKAAVASGLSLPRSWIVIWLLPGVSIGAVAAILSMLAWAAVLAFAS